MRLIIFGLALATAVISSPGFTQVRQWTDDQGIVHYEVIGPKKIENKNPSEPKPNALGPIERTHAGLRLGDDESSFAAARKGLFIGKSGSEGNYYRFSGPVPEGVTGMGLLFSSGRLALIKIEYRDLGAKGWKQLIHDTAKKYGPPREDAELVSWSDGTTLLTLNLGAAGDITVTLEDLAAMSKYSEEQRAALPKL